MTYKLLTLKEKLINAYNAGGFVTIIIRLAKKTYNDLFAMHKSYWYDRDLAKPFNNVTPKIKVSICYGPLEETLKWEESNARKSRFCSEDFKEIQIAQENEHKYITLKQEDNILGFLKVGFRKVYFKEYRRILNLPQDLAFIYDTYILENYRGKSLASYLVNEVMNNLSKEGIKAVMCHILPENAASQRTYTKINYKQIGTVVHLRIFGVNIYNISPKKVIKTSIEYMKNMGKIHYDVK